MMLIGLLAMLIGAALIIYGGYLRTEEEAETQLPDVRYYSGDED